jgi:hypothetical protein
MSSTTSSNLSSQSNSIRLGDKRRRSNSDSCLNYDYCQEYKDFLPRDVRNRIRLQDFKRVKLKKDQEALTQDFHYLKTDEDSIASNIASQASWDKPALSHSTADWEAADEAAEHIVESALNSIWEADPVEITNDKDSLEGSERMDDCES